MGESRRALERGRGRVVTSSELTQFFHVRPGIIYLLSFFYLRREIGFRVGLFASAAPIATTFAGALAYGIVHGDSRLKNWRLLFLRGGPADHPHGPNSILLHPRLARQSKIFES